jgi:hypothetical protein
MTRADFLNDHGATIHYILLSVSYKKNGQAMSCRKHTPLQPSIIVAVRRRHGRERGSYDHKMRRDTVNEKR